MSWAVRLLTDLVLSLPLIIAVAGVARARSAAVALYIAGGLALMYVLVFLWSRPFAYAIEGSTLAVHRPLRTTRVPLGDVVSVTLLSTAEFKQAYGLAVRIGVGGLWGVFGWLWTSRRGLVDVCTTRHDWMVSIERTGGRPLLISPASPQEFVSYLSRRGRSA